MSVYSRHMTDFAVAGMRYWDGALVLDELKVGGNFNHGRRKRQPSRS